MAGYSSAVARQHRCAWRMRISALLVALFSILPTLSAAQTPGRTRLHSDRGYGPRPPEPAWPTEPYGAPVACVERIHQSKAGHERPSVIDAPPGHPQTAGFSAGKPALSRTRR